MSAPVKEYQDADIDQSELKNETLKAYGIQLSLTYKESYLYSRNIKNGIEDCKEIVQHFRGVLNSVKNVLAQANEDQKALEEDIEIVQKMEANLLSTKDRLDCSLKEVNASMEKICSVPKLFQEIIADSNGKEKLKETIRMIKVQLESTGDWVTGAPAPKSNVMSVLGSLLILKGNIKGNKTLGLQRMENKCVAFIQTCDKKMADVTEHECDVGALLREVGIVCELLRSELKSSDDANICMRSTRNKLQTSLKICSNWLLFYEKKLQQSDHLNSESDEPKLFNWLDLNQSVDIDSHGGTYCHFISESDESNLFNKWMDLNQSVDIDSQGDFYCSAFDGPSISFLSTSGASDDSDTQNENSSSSETEMSSPVMRSQFLPTPYSRRKSNESLGSHSLPWRIICARGGSPSRTTGLVANHRKHCLLNTTSKLDRPGNSSLDQNAPNITFGECEDVLISSPITPSLKEQSMNFQYDHDPVHVGYQQFQRECSEVRNHSQKKKTNDPPNPVKRNIFDSDSDVMVLESDENDIDVPVPNNAVTIDPRDIPSCLYASCPKFEGNRSAFKPTGHCASLINNYIYANTNDHQAAYTESEIDYFLNASRLPGEVMCSEVVTALEQLVSINNDEELLKIKSNQLEASLQKCTNSMHTLVANVTVGFLCSRYSTPLQDYLTTNDKEQLFPFDEICVVRAFENLARPDFTIELEAVVYRAIVGENTKRPIFVLSTLCRLWTYFKALKNSVNDVRSICYDILKRHPDKAPYLIASIISVYPEVLHPPAKESEYYLHQAMCHLISNKPTDLEENLWVQSIHLIGQYLNLDTGPAVEDIIHAAIQTFKSKSSVEKFSIPNTKNYVYTVELLAARFDWSWKYHNVIMRHLVPLIEKFTATGEMESCGAAALTYSILGYVGVGHLENKVLVNFVINTYKRLSGKKVPGYVSAEAFSAVFLMEYNKKK